MSFRVRIIFYLLLFWAKIGSSTLYSQLSDFERKALDEAMAFYNLQPEDQPENKVISNIYIFTKDPFTQESGFLTLLNHLHVKSKEDIIRRELFVKIGDSYDSVLIQNSER